MLTPQTRRSGSTERARLPAALVGLLAAWQIAAVSFISLLPVSCGHPTSEPVTLRYPHGWRFEPDEVSTRVNLTQQFSQRTGIQVREVPAPDNTFDQLELWRKLLKEDPSGIDLVGVDPIWSATLDSDLIDLAPDAAAETSSLEPALLHDYTVNEKLVAIPDQVNVGALEYRSDLLRKYGYHHPPAT
jgi:ABC-type glycerol-3-phosphate transport system substrate-binding protein